MRRGPSSFRDRAAKATLDLVGMARRVVVTMTKPGFWQLLGFEDGEGNKEDFQGVETFQQVGFVSRPRAGSTAEVVVINIGAESGHPAIVATRDKAIEPDHDADESVVFNSVKTIRIKPNGEVHIGFAPGETPGPLDGLVHGSGIDPWTGQTYTVLGNTSGVVKGKK